MPWEDLALSLIVFLEHGNWHGVHLILIFKLNNSYIFELKMTFNGVHIEKFDG